MDTALWTRQFWKTTREVSISGIIQEAERPITIVVCGEVSFVEDVHATIGMNLAIESADPFAFKPSNTRILAITEGPDTPRPTGSFTYCAEQIGGLDRTIERILEDNPDYTISLARQYPGLRQRVSDEILHFPRHMSE